MGWGPYTKVKRMLETAAMNALQANSDGRLDDITAYTGRTRSELVAPRYFAYVGGAEPMFSDDGVLMWWECELYLGVSTNMHDTDQDTHDDYMATVQDFAMRRDVPDIINANPDNEINMQDGIFGWEPGTCNESDGPEITEAIKITARVQLEN